MTGTLEARMRQIALPRNRVSHCALLAMAVAFRALAAGGSAQADQIGSARARGVDHPGKPVRRGLFIVVDHQEEIGRRELRKRRPERGIDRAGIGCMLEDPFIDYAKVVQGMGVHAEGPITDPRDLGPAIQRAAAIVRRGEPALVDVVTQPR